MSDIATAVPRPAPHQMKSNFVDVDGIRTHYLEGGSGPLVVLLHSGEFGGCAEFSWEYNFAHLTATHRVIAPDWLGFGQTDKVYDFANAFDRRLRHMARFLEVMDIVSPDIVANSMGATFLLRDAASDRPWLTPRSMVAIAGGGRIPDNDARHALLNYDTTLESMRAVVSALFHDPIWAADDAYVTRRREESLRPGAWECAEAARLRSPTSTERSVVGAPDLIQYEKISFPVLLITGVEDRLKEPGHGRELRNRMPHAQLIEVESAAHCPHIEKPELVNDAISAFLAEKSL